MILALSEALQTHSDIMNGRTGLRILRRNLRGFQLLHRANSSDAYPRRKDKRKTPVECRTAAHHPSMIEKAS